MPHRFSAAFDRMTIAGAVVAVIAILSLMIGVLAAMPGPEAEIQLLPTSEPSAVRETDPELAAADVVREAGLAGEFSFVLYDSVKDRYLLSHGADEIHFSMSVSKVMIAVGALRYGADPSVVAKMLSLSDDSIANQLWGEVDGPAVIREQAAAMGLEHTTPSPDWGRWGDVSISASDVVRMYEYLLEELPTDEREVIIGALESMEELGSDGYDQTFGIPDAAGELDWAAKQGWGCCKPDRYLVSTGTLGADHRYIAAIFGAWDETRVGEAQSAAEMTAVAAALVETLADQA